MKVISYSRKIMLRISYKVSHIELDLINPFVNKRFYNLNYRELNI